VARFGRYGTDMLAIADFNGDGKADLAVANTEAKGIFVLLGTGGGRFGAARNVASRRYGGRLVIADFNRDGRVDVRDLAAARRNLFASLALLTLG